jgi:hypothetical protein
VEELFSLMTLQIIVAAMAAFLRNEKRHFTGTA